MFEIYVNLVKQNLLTSRNQTRENFDYCVFLKIDNVSQNFLNQTTRANNRRYEIFTLNLIYQFNIIESSTNFV